MQYKPFHFLLLYVFRMLNWMYCLTSLLKAIQHVSFRQIYISIYGELWRQTTGWGVVWREGVVIGLETTEALPSVLHVNKHTLGMRHWNNGGLSFEPGLMMSVFLLYDLWSEKLTTRQHFSVCKLVCTTSEFVCRKVEVTLCTRNWRSASWLTLAESEGSLSDLSPLHT